MEIEETLRQAEYDVVGPIAGLDEALLTAARAALDAALLDIDLRGELPSGVAYLLRGRRIPFAFVTGHHHGGALPMDLMSEPIFAKPLSARDCLTITAGLLGGG
jgi:hypothetical protein